MILNIKKSKYLIGLVAVSHVGAALLILFLPIGFWFKALAIVVILGAGSRAWRRLPRGMNIEAELNEEGRCRFHSEPVWYRVVRAARDPFAVRLTLENPYGRRRPLLILRDAVDAATYHELCSRIAQRRLPFP